MSVTAKKLRFALTACGVDPATVTINAPTHDSHDVECNKGDALAVQRALQLWLSAHLDEKLPNARDVS